MPFGDAVEGALDAVQAVFGHDVFVPAGVWGLLVAALGAIVKSDYYFRIYQ